VALTCGTYCSAGPACQPHAEGQREGKTVPFLWTPGTEEVGRPAAPAGTGGAGGERRGRGDALVCAHPREVAAPPETPHGALATSAGGKERWRQAVAVLRCRATGCEARGRCNVR
jgi:hypothetical protein